MKEEHTMQNLRWIINVIKVSWLVGTLGTAGWLG
jgi:hypothetical protein